MVRMIGVTVATDRDDGIDMGTHTYRDALDLVELIRRTGFFKDDAYRLDDATVIIPDEDSRAPYLHVYVTSERAG